MDFFDTLIDEGEAMPPDTWRSTKNMTENIRNAIENMENTPLDLKNAPPQEEEKSPENTGFQEAKAKIILVAYMRGGSSLVGSLFAQNSDAFYMFESLSSLYGAMAALPPYDFITTVTHQANLQPRSVSVVLVQQKQSFSKAGKPE